MHVPNMIRTGEMKKFEFFPSNETMKIFTFLDDSYVEPEFILYGDL